MVTKAMKDVIARANALLGRLEDAKAPVRFMMVTTNEDGVPVILLETPLFKRIGLRETYRYFARLADAVHDDDLVADDLFLILPGSPLANAISSVFGGELRGTEFSNSVSNGVPLNGTVILHRKSYDRRELATSVKEMKDRLRELELAA